MKTIIVGGVAGGASAAARLRRLDEQAEILLLERGPYISYANCGLPYYVGGEIEEEADLTMQSPQSFYARFRIDVRVRHEALRIDRQAKRLLIRKLDGGEEYWETYDKLILAPGAEPVVPPIPGLDPERVMTLRTIPDARRIRAFLEQRRPRRAVIVGGGAIGLEMAENLLRAGLSVAIAEAADHVIAGLDYDAACDVHRYLRRQGVELHLADGVKAFQPLPDGLAVELQSGSLLEADLVILSIGGRPDISLAEAAGLPCDSRAGIRVNGHMQTADPDIYAVGDAVEVPNIVTGQPAKPMLAGPANKQGRIAADHICGLPSAYRGAQTSGVVKFFDLTIAMTGINETAARAQGIPCDKVFLYSPSHATYYPGASNISLKVVFQLETGRILGAQLVGYQGVDKRCDVLAVAVRAGMTAQDLEELELCYAPPFSSAKDPVNMAGYAIGNLLAGRVRQCHWHDIPNLPRDGSAILLDVRTPREYERSHIEGFRNIPLDQLRERLGELEAGKMVYVNCQSGLRSYIASRILTQNGFPNAHLAGGYRLYEAVMGEGEAEAAHACGLPLKR